MIWIATLCLLAIAAWLFFNALNERRWVEAHSHDESVRADPGILPDFSAMMSKMSSGTDGRVSIDQEDSAFARAVAKVREKSEKVGERIERRAAEGRERDDGDTFFGRAVAKVGGTVNGMDERLDARARRAAERRSGSVTEEDSLFGRATARVARKQEEYGARMRERVARKAATDQPARPAAEEDGLFGSLVRRVSGRLERMEGKIDAKAAKARDGKDEDFLMRTSSKVGGRVNEIDERIVAKSKDAAKWVDKKTDL